MRHTVVRLAEQQLTHRVMERPLNAAIYRGGTSRGVIFRDDGLAHYSQADRDKILCAVRSPDPDGRQINGLGAGTSSTSKVAVVHPSGSQIARLARHYGDPFPGLPWLDDRAKVQSISDVVYHFGQVIIKEERIDWGSTCGNMVAAAAHFAITRSLAKKPNHIPYVDNVLEGEVHNWPVRLISHDTGKVVIAHVPVAKTHNPKLKRSFWAPRILGDTAIAGVPGTAPGILIESPLEGNLLPTGNVKDAIELDGKEIEVSIVDTGLPVVIVSAESLDIPLSQLLEHPTSIESNKQLMERLEQVRHKASSLTPNLQKIFSTPSPKLCIVHPRSNYISTGGESYQEDDMDLLVRVVSSGQLHRTIPATTLSALAAARSFHGSILSEIINSSSCTATLSAQSKLASYSRESEEDGASLQSITVGQPAGCSTASVRLDAAGQPSSTLMMRTAHNIMTGWIDVPPMPCRMAVIDAYPSIFERRKEGPKKKEQTRDSNKYPRRHARDDTARQSMRSDDVEKRYIDG